jgi:two-component system, chemotaxis family, chemotaxis protein CheY
VTNGRSGKTVLVIEDDQEIREALAQALGMGSYRVLTAYNGRDAIEQLEREASPPSLIVLDWMMPVMGGLEFLEAIAPDPVRSTVPVVVLSAVDRALKLSGLPVAAVLTKPVRMRTLMEVVDRLCDMPGRVGNGTGRFATATERVPAPERPGRTPAPTVVIRHGRGDDDDKK